MADVGIRPVETADAEAIQAIYAPIVETSHISFELIAPSRDEMARRIKEAEQLPWLVAVDEGRRVVGYAYAARHGGRDAYAWAVDTSIYLDAAVRGRGIGTALYADLLTRLRALGYVSAFAGIALPNAASVALHQRVGFEATGSFPVAGYKLGRWIDVSLWRSALAEPSVEPSRPQPWR
jgi:L-amino acid N-acyltransferase YncA